MEDEKKTSDDAANSLKQYEGKTLEEMRQRAEGNFRKPKETKVEPPTPEQLAYIKKIEDSKRADTDFTLNSLLKSALGARRPVKIIPYPVPLEDCETLFFAIIENMLAQQDKKFVLEEANEPKVFELIKYFAGYPSKLDAMKGIYLFGAVGRGKTYILHALMIMCNTIETKLAAACVPYTARRFQMKNAKSIVNELAESKKPEVMKQYYGKSWCFDDFGAEDSLKLWGNDLNVLGDIVIERYQKFQHSGLLTHATSNVPSEQWKTKYGDRVDSRLEEMFNVIRLEGEDKRKI